MSNISGCMRKVLLGAGLITISALSLLVPARAMAGKWYFDPVVSMKLGYSDNTQLSTTDKIATASSTITGNAVFGFSTETSDVSLSARMVDDRFDDHSNLNSNDQFLAFTSSFRTDRNQFGLDAGYDRVSTRTSEFDYTGYSTSEGYSITKSIRPYWSRSLTERTSLKIDGAYSKTTYEDTGSSGLSDYTNRSVNMSLQRQLTERSSLQTVVGVSQYKSASTEYETTSLQFGLNHMFSETFSVNMLLGPSYTKSRSDSTGGEEITNVGKLINLGFSKQFELTTLSGALSTSESAGGEGKLTKSTKLNLALQRKISDRASLSVSGSVSQNESGGGLTDSSSDRTYMSFSPALSWKATPWWTITGSYSYQRSENTSSDAGPAESNAVFVSMQYVWPQEPH